MKRIVIIGATSAIAEHCARLWLAEAPADLILLGRDAARTERVAADLRVRNHESKIQHAIADFMDPAAIRRFVDAVAAGGAIDIVLIAHGAMGDQAASQADLAACRDVLDITGLSPVLFAEAFSARMEEQGRGTIALIGSVAGDRGRKANYVYGAAKSLVARYAQGMQHRFANSNLKIVLIKPGPTDTPMTVAQKAAGMTLAPVETVAKAIVAGVSRNRPLVYAPGKWRLIMLIVQHLPAFVFNKLNI